MKKTTVFKPSPGIAIIEPIKDDTSSITLTSKQESRLLKGKVIALGNNIITDANALLEQPHYAELGDIVYFLSYEGNYDNFMYDGKKYYAVKWQDLRVVIE